LGLPATIGLSLIAEPIIRTLFEHGAFTHQDTMATVQALRAYALGIPGFLLVKVFASGFFARHDTKTPVKIAVIAMVVNVCASLLLLSSLKHIGIALANSIAVSLNAALLYYELRKRGVQIGDHQLPTRIKKIIFCALIMASVTWILTVWLWDRAPLSSLSHEIIILAWLIGLSGLSYGVALYAIGAMRLKQLLDLKRPGGSL
jgi:putative peptidoglycan lipid II flippase